MNNKKLNKLKKRADSLRSALRLDLGGSSLDTVDELVWIEKEITLIEKEEVDKMVTHGRRKGMSIYEKYKEDILFFWEESDNTYDKLEFLIRVLKELHDYECDCGTGTHFVIELKEFLLEYCELNK